MIGRVSPERDYTTIKLGMQPGSRILTTGEIETPEPNTTLRKLDVQNVAPVMEVDNHVMTSPDRLSGREATPTTIADHIKPTTVGTNEEICSADDKPHAPKLTASNMQRFSELLLPTLSHQDRHWAAHKYFIQHERDHRELTVSDGPDTCDKHSTWATLGRQLGMKTATSFASYVFVPHNHPRVDPYFITPNLQVYSVSKIFYGIDSDHPPLAEHWIYNTLSPYNYQKHFINYLRDFGFSEICMMTFAMITDPDEHLQGDDFITGILSIFDADIGIYKFMIEQCFTGMPGMEETQVQDMAALNLFRDFLWYLVVDPSISEIERGDFFATPEGFYERMEYRPDHRRSDTRVRYIRRAIETMLGTVFLRSHLSDLHARYAWAYDTSAHKEHMKLLAPPNIFYEEGVKPTITKCWVSPTTTPSSEKSNHATHIDILGCIV